MAGDRPPENGEHPPRRAPFFEHGQRNEREAARHQFEPEQHDQDESDRKHERARQHDARLVGRR